MSRTVSLFRRCLPALAALSLAFGSGAALTAEAVQAADAPLLELDAAASQTVRLDKVQITLEAEVEGKDQVEVSRKLNAALQEISAKAKAMPALKLHNGRYWVDQQYVPEANGIMPARKKVWRGSAVMIVESKDFEAASDFAASVSHAAAIDGLYFMLSDEAREQVKSELLAKAAKAFREKAEVAAKAFGFSRYEIRTLSLDNARAPQPMFKNSMMARAAMAASAMDESSGAPMEAGDTTVSVEVSGAVALY